MGNELYDLVDKAQQGDQTAMNTILSMFMPAIQKEKIKVNGDRQQDLEQTIIETLVKKILTYDINTLPGYAAFIDQLIRTDSTP